MSRLDSASARLNAALDVLEKTAIPLVKTRGSAEDAAARIAALTEESDRLMASVAELEEEARALSGLAEEVDGRLDGAIADIRAALGR